jgi:hypothetical protein
MVGQHGVFGKVVAITTRLYKRPAGAILATFAPNSRIIGRLLPSTAKPQWTLLTADALLCGYVADQRTLDFYEKTLPEQKPRSVERRTLEADIEHRTQLWRGDFRAAVPPAKVQDFVAVAKPAQWVADAAFGVVLGQGEEAAIRSAAQALAGTVSFPRRDGVIGVAFDVPSGPQRQLLERIKLAFDPDNKLAPLPWQTQPVSQP